MSKQRKNGDKTRVELERAKRQQEIVKKQKPSVDKLVESLRNHLDENGFAKRLYLQMMRDQG